MVFPVNSIANKYIGIDSNKNSIAGKTKITQKTSFKELLPRQILMKIFSMSLMHNSLLGRILNKTREGLLEFHSIFREKCTKFNRIEQRVNENGDMGHARK